MREDKRYSVWVLHIENGLRQCDRVNVTALEFDRIRRWGDGNMRGYAIVTEDRIRVDAELTDLGIQV